MQTLNDDTIVHITSFLSNIDKWTLIRKMNNHTLITLTKKVKVKFHLTGKSSRRYHADEMFRQHVRSIVHRDADGQHFLCLNLSYCHVILDVSALEGV